MNYEEIFKDQLANNTPYTFAQIDFIIKAKTARMKLRELAKVGAYLKSKIGTQRLEYSYFPDQPGKPLPITDKVWADELDTLNALLVGYSHVGYADFVPVFKKL